MYNRQNCTLSDQNWLTIVELLVKSFSRLGHFQDFNKSNTEDSEPRSRHYI